jgi:tetratricopeptide (TPR) repeat protein
MIFENYESNEAIDAANYALEITPSTNLLVRELAQHILDPTSLGSTQVPKVADGDQARQTTARLKRIVREYPFVPLAWSDLSLCYAILGHTEKTKRAMQVAIALGSQNNLILRSAARCFMHIGEPDRAIALLQDSGIWSTDPWIASAEIAISEGMGVQSRSLKIGRSLVDDDNLSIHSRSELAACLGTLEIRSGSVRRAKSLMQKALREPTENALAQAEWMSTHLGIEVRSNTFTVPAPYEAHARHYYRIKDFRTSLSASKEWGRFQPFSSRPFAFASYLASVCLEDDALAIQILKGTSLPLRGSPLLANNLAFALARQNRLAEAIRTINTIDVNGITDRERFTLSATKGLISFRSGQVEDARKLYQQTVKGFDRIRESRSAAIAVFFWAVEEKRLKSDLSALRIAEARKRIKSSDVFELTNAADLL